MTLENRIKAEKNRVSGQLQQLHKQNEVDQENLNELKHSYHQAIMTNVEQDIDYINSQIKEVMSRIARRNDMIEAMSDKNNPIIQTMVFDEIEKNLGKIYSLEDQAKERLEELYPVHQELLHGLLEVNELYQKAKNARGLTNSFSSYLNDASRKKLNIKAGGVDAIGPISNQMRKYIIQDKDIFKQ
jgi:hypothetical protein